MGEFTSTEAIRYEAKFASANLIKPTNQVRKFFANLLFH